MKCKKCGGDSKVLETRKREGYVFRRRRCKKCGTAFPTMEVYRDAM